MGQTHHSRTHSYNEQVRVFNQPNMSVYGLWEEARVPEETQAREEHANMSQNQTQRLLGML